MAQPRVGENSHMYIPRYMEVGISPGGRGVASVVVVRGKKKKKNGILGLCNRQGGKRGILDYFSHQYAFLLLLFYLAIWVSVIGHWSFRAARVQTCFCDNIGILIPRKLLM